jgi:hypothetical protein
MRQQSQLTKGSEVYNTSHRADNRHYSIGYSTILILIYCLLIGRMELREIGCEDGRWMELAQDCVQWWALVLAMLNLLVLLPES